MIYVLVLVAGVAVGAAVASLVCARTTWKLADTVRAQHDHTANLSTRMLDSLVAGGVQGLAQLRSVEGRHRPTDPVREAWESAQEQLEAMGDVPVGINGEP